MAYYENIVSSVGSTPLVKLNRVTAGLPATIALKGEFNNPLGSVKDRIGAAMISQRRTMGGSGPGLPSLNRPAANVFGGWDAAQNVHFADGGYFDQIYQAK